MQLRQWLIQVIHDVRHISITIGPSSSSSQHSGLSSGAIGGIVGGILGTLLLISVAALFYVLGSRKAKRAPSTSPEAPAPLKESEIEKNDGGGLVVQQGEVEETDLGGRLRYPTDNDIGGRLGTLD